jgi:acetyl-CoA carboxylase carboxyl transferase subunit alpha
LWKSSAKASEAAEVLKLTAPDLLNMGIIDEVVSEPLGGAHREPEKMAQVMREVIKRNLRKLGELSKEELLKLRYEKFRKIGAIG